jgi:glutathione S-transferase
MKLYGAAASPFVRKVRVAIIECGLHSQVEEVDVAIAPTAPDDQVNENNPLGKVPALVADDGLNLFDSRVIAEYLDSLTDGVVLIPAAGDARWHTLRLQAFADGIMDAGVSRRYETFLRPDEKRWGDWVAGQKAKITRSLDMLEQRSGRLADRLDIGTIALACALGYLDFRFAVDGWRDNRPGLAAFYEAFASRESMQRTQPPAG